MRIDQLISITQATKLCPERPATTTVWRWCRHGVKARNGDRIALQHVRRGGKLYTTQEALEKFFKDTADADHVYFDQKAESPGPKLNHGAAARRKSVDSAKSNMDKAGIR